MIPRGERGATAGDTLIFLATLSVAAALLYPAWSVRGFRARVESAVADVDALSSAALAARAETDRWPTEAPAGETPPELPGLGGEEGIFDRIGYTLEWTSWEVVDSVPAPPVDAVPARGDAPPVSVEPHMLPVVRRFGAVVVHSGEADLLAELLDHYSADSSFVLDTMFLLVLPERAEAPAPPR